MRKLDIILVGLGLVGLGGAAYFGLQQVGLGGLQAGVWSQAILFVGLLGWLLTYLLRVGGGKMTYHQQLKDYQDAVLQKRLEELTPEELAQLQTEVEQEKSNVTHPDPTSSRSARP
jgi:Protein of unknown function (DUF3007)